MRKKKISKKVGQKETKSRAKCSRPTELGKLIDDVKDVKSNIPLEYSREIESNNQFSPDPGATASERAPGYVAYSIELFERCFREFDEQSRTKLLEEAKLHITKTNPGIAERNILHRAIALTIHQYDVIVSKHTVLFSVAKFFAELRKGDYKPEGENAILTKDGEPLYLPTIYNQISRTGTIGKVDTGVAAAFHNIDLDRIRLCQICSRIFWAKNKNSETCSEPCRNALKQRKHREKNKEVINSKRRENYNRNKKLKEIRSKNNVNFPTPELKILLV